MQQVTLTDDCGTEPSIVIPSSMLAGLGGNIDPNLVGVRAANNGLLELGRRLLNSAELGDTDEVRQLMSRGAPFTTDWLGTSPLHAAAANGHLETCEVLLRAGISRDSRTKVDRTPLHAAAQEGHTAIVRLLLESSADVNARDMLRMTPLHWAVEREHVECVRLLLQHGADPGLVSKFGKTPFTIARESSRHDILDMLKTTAATTAAATASESLSLVMGQVPVATHQEEVITSDMKEEEVNILSTEEEHPSAAEVFVQEVGEAISTSTARQPTAVAATEEVEEVVIEEETVVDENDTNCSSGMLRLLQAHGITMLPADNSTLVASAVRSGQSIVLTEAGKLALNQTLHSTRPQKVITLRKAVIPSSSMPRRGRPPTAINRHRHQPPNILKRPVATTSTKQVVSASSAEMAAIKRQLEEVQREAQTYRLLLSEKECEAERYRLKLQSIAQQSQ